MIIKALEALTDVEAQQILQAPAVITILIAAADNKIDEDETEWARKVLDYRKTIGDEGLFDYYEIVEAEFEATLAALLEDNAVGNQERIGSLSTNLSDLNPIIAKLNKLYAKKLVDSWRSLAKQVAKASGGVLGFGSVSKQEEKLVGLDMIDLK